MKEKQGFIELCLRQEGSMTERCRVFGISRETGHTWWRRFKEQGVSGLQEQSRSPNHSPQAIDSAMAQRLVQLRKNHPTWGPVKLVAYLERRMPEEKFPAPSTVGELLKREGLVRAKRRRMRAARFITEHGGYHGPNAMWCADYKGEFRCQNSKRCYPLTISDGYSRALLRCEGLISTNYLDAKKVFVAAFSEFGLPDAIRTDNGSPFSSLSGLSQLSVWWILLGIHPVRIQPGKPTQNGRHERIHKTLKEDVLRDGAQKNLRAQQRAFDRFIHTYNEERPHESLGNDTPASRYTKSIKAYPTKLTEPHYRDEAEVFRLNKYRELLYKQKRIPISPLIANYPVGIIHADQQPSKLFFGSLLLGHFAAHSKFKRGAPLKPRTNTPIFMN